jgi:hypothetical protein
MSTPNHTPQITVPSRRFLVTQAVLDAYEVYANRKTKRLLGRAAALECYTCGDWVRPDFCAAVRTEYRRIASKYGVVA